MCVFVYVCVYVCVGGGRGSVGGWVYLFPLHFKFHKNVILLQSTVCFCYKDISNVISHRECSVTLKL